MERATEMDKALLRRCAEVAHRAMEEGNHPFGALLADKDGNVLMEQGNAFTEGGSAYHAETLLVLRAAKEYSPDFLAGCTLYTNFEPCCMCTGAVYWSGIGRIVYGLSEKRLLEETGDNHENPTFSLSSREVISRGQRDVEIVGPIEDDEELAELILRDHRGFWESR